MPVTTNHEHPGSYRAAPPALSDGAGPGPGETARPDPLDCLDAEPGAAERAGPRGLDRDRDLISGIFQLRILEREGAEDDPEKET